VRAIYKGASLELHARPQGPYSPDSPHPLPTSKTVGGGPAMPSKQSLGEDHTKLHDADVGSNKAPLEQVRKPDSAEAIL